jgi:hypothetical protein
LGKTAFSAFAYTLHFAFIEQKGKSTNPRFWYSLNTYSFPFSPLLMDTDKPVNPAAAFLASVQNGESTPALPADVAHLFPKGSGTSPVQPATSAPAPTQQPQDFAIAKDTPATPPPAPAPAPAPSAELEQPAAPESNELATPAGKRPLAHFGQALPATKSKANRKLVLQLTPEMYQYFAHVATLPGLDGVPLSNLAVAILQAWREDYRPDIKRANAAFKA